MLLRLTSFATLLTATVGVCAQAIVFNPSTGILLIPSVRVGSSTYSNVRLRADVSLEFVLTEATPVPGTSAAAAVYDIDSGVLRLPIVDVAGASYRAVTLQNMGDYRFRLRTAAAPSLALPPLRIWPLGDSLTAGTPQGGYRSRLHAHLIGAGYPAEFIGTLTVNGASLTDPEHDGHSGWTIAQVADNVPAWLERLEDPDVVLLLLGTNDFSEANYRGSAITRLDDFIGQIAAARPQTHIIVANLMVREEPANSRIVSEFNPLVESIVNAHAAAGRRVKFLDMRPVVPLSQMSDGLHPSQAGYDRMADVWYAGIQSVLSPDGDALPPAISRAVAIDAAQVAITFSKPVADDATELTNYTISDGRPIHSAMLDAARRTVSLTIGPGQPAPNFSVRVSHVRDRRTPVPNPIAPESTVVVASASKRGYVNNIPGAACYRIVYSLDLPDKAAFAVAPVPYAIDRSDTSEPFDRVAYYVELQRQDRELQYLWVSMDAFTNDLKRVGVPTASSGGFWQRPVANLTVLSNSPRIGSGKGFVGNLEFWHASYGTANAAPVGGASDSTYDFGDSPFPTGTYGSMQIHHSARGQTLFAFNNWAGSGENGFADLGIGNDPAPLPNGGPDWTLRNNAQDYSTKLLQILVRPTASVLAPTCP